jgi:hypothetical protein
MKKILTGVLLAFVAASVAALIYKETRPRTTASGPPPTADRLVAYYFHGNVRCPTCLKIEHLCRKNLATRLEFQTVNLDEEAHRHFVQDFQLESRTLVLARYQTGQPTRWKQLNEVWTLAHDEPAFAEYVARETDQFLKEAH